MSTMQAITFERVPPHRRVPAALPHAMSSLLPGASSVALKAALSAMVQRRNGAREPVRLLYYRAHSLLRAVRQPRLELSARAAS